MSEQRYHLEASERRRLERKFWATGLLVSVLLHVAVFVGWRGSVLPPSPFAAAGPRANSPRAAGGGSMHAMNLSFPTYRPITSPPPPLSVEVEVEQVVIEEEPLLDPRTVLAARPGEGTGTGGAGTGTGGAVGPGTGRGDGGNAAEGRYRLQPPVPRGMIIPPSNRSLKGTTVEVWVFVDENGRVVPDSTRLNPPTRDRGFNQRLVREAAEWVFRPAIQAGKPVASWFPYQISM